MSEKDRYRYYDGNMEEVVSDRWRGEFRLSISWRQELAACVGEDLCQRLSAIRDNTQRGCQTDD